jgi:hypothetical protein
MIWFALAAFWGLDSGLALSRHNRLQAGLTTFFACCFLLAGLVLRRREKNALRSRETADLSTTLRSGRDDKSVGK